TSLAVAILNSFFFFKNNLWNSRIVFCCYQRLTEEHPRLYSNCTNSFINSILHLSSFIKISNQKSSDKLNAAIQSSISSPLFSSKKKEEEEKQMSLIPSFFGGRKSNIFDPFSLDVWDPFLDFPISTNLANFQSSYDFANARIDWKETPEAHIFKVDVPGIKKEEVKVEVEEGRVLQISGERSREQEEKNDQWHRMERSSGKFVRRFRLPEKVKMGEIKAAMENGVLTVTIPKEEEKKKPEVKAIDISA
ncbi:17.3 kDa class I heat shock protein-like, partial [Solanum dulcamara]|uniref:17.3 kDa class I heat shock protein-like n=1 Tax=Solanum dulcamara TaxID=45834 RepID=UPI002485835D